MFSTRLLNRKVHRLVLSWSISRFVFRFLFPLLMLCCCFSFLLFLFLLLHGSQTPTHSSNPVVHTENRLVPSTAAAFVRPHGHYADSSRSLLTGSSPVYSLGMDERAIQEQDATRHKHSLIMCERAKHSVHASASKRRPQPLHPAAASLFCCYQKLFFRDHA